MAEILTNDATDQLAGDINSSTTSIVVNSGSQFPATGNFRIRIDNEIMTVTGVSGTTWTVTRASEALMGQQAPSAHLNGAIVYGVLTAGSLVSSGGTPGVVTASTVIVAGTSKQIDTLAITTPVFGSDSTPGSANQILRLIGKKTGIPDATATSFATVTIPNVAVSAMLKVTCICSPNNGGVGDTTRFTQNFVAITRTPGKNAAAAIVANSITLAGIATVSAGTTITQALTGTSISGTVTAVNTFDLQIGITKTGSATDHQCFFEIEVLNAETGGITVAAV